MYVCVCIYIYIYIYTHTFRFQSAQSSSLTQIGVKKIEKTFNDMQRIHKYSQVCASIR